MNLSKTRGHKRDKTASILDKAWKMQSVGLRSEGRCVGCGSSNGMISGHLVHGGRGKSHTRLIDFNVCLPVQNIFCQCSYCNTYDPDGNGKLRDHFNRTHGNKAVELYDKLKSIKQQTWNPTEEEALEVLRKTKQRYEDFKTQKENA